MLSYHYHGNKSQALSSAFGAYTAVAVFIIIFGMGWPCQPLLAAEQRQQCCGEQKKTKRQKKQQSAAYFTEAATTKLQLKAFSYRRSMDVCVWVGFFGNATTKTKPCNWAQWERRCQPGFFQKRLSQNSAKGIYRENSKAGTFSSGGWIILKKISLAHCTLPNYGINYICSISFCYEYKEILLCSILHYSIIPSALSLSFSQGISSITFNRPKRVGLFYSRKIKFKYERYSAPSSLTKQLQLDRQQVGSSPFSPQN